jgi:hypothetical protein
MLVYLVCLISFGCADSARPNDLPKLYPCTITITQSNTPLAGATVEFVPTNQPDAKYHALAITDDNGNVQMSTYGYAGVPLGTYKIIVRKNIDDDFVYAIDESSGEQNIVSYKKYQLVESKFINAETTPHEIEITNKRNHTKTTLDVGEPIKILIE